MSLTLKGLIAATYTPFKEDGSLNVGVIKDYVDYLVDAQLSGLYVCGSTGEGVNMSVDERKQVASAFVKATGGRVPVIVQVGANSLADCRELASHAQSIGADAISANAPSYFKVDSPSVLAEYMAELSAAAPNTPFYYYHIPAFTGSSVDLLRFMECAETSVPQLVGIKYTDLKVFEFQEAMNFKNGKYQLLWGCDEMLLSALAVGAVGGVGSTYGQIPRVYRAVISAWEDNRIDDARREQLKSVEYVKILNRYGNLHSAQKAVLKKVGFDMGACRLPIPPLDSEGCAKLYADLDVLGFPAF
jgi:N-acetylneuraminate lyase